METAAVTYLPIYVLPAVILALFAAIILAAWAVKTSSRRSPEEGRQERDWSVPAVDVHAHLSSPFHHWDARIKIASLLTFIFCVASVRHIIVALAALCVAVAAVLAARIPLSRPARRLAAMGSFLAMFLVIMPVTVPNKPGDSLVIFDHLSFLSFNARGFLLAALVCLKASTIALMMEPLLGSSTLAVTMEALARLGVPRRVGQMLLLAHRYIFVFHHEAGRMSSSMAVRGFRKRTDMETLRTVGNFIGMLLVRSFERTQRVYEAMLCRGYRDAMPNDISFSARRSDWVKGVFWIVLGFGLLCIDRLWSNIKL